MIRAVRGALVVVAVTLLLGLPAAGSARAADVTFGAPEARATYGESIEFSVPLTAAVPLVRVELRLRFPDAVGPYVVDVPVAAGDATPALSYTLDLSGGGHLVPNTPIEATWAAVTADGLTVTSRTATVRYSDTSRDWKTLAGDVVRVHWYEGGQAFGRRALDIAEEAIANTGELLGVTETEPVDFFIYGDETTFRTALGPGTRENVGGQAHSDIRTLFALITPDAIDDPWVGIVVPHELVHLVLDTAVENPYRFPPRWLNEGLAVYLSESFTNADRRRVERAVASGDLLPLDALGGQFPTDADLTFLAYAESVSAVDHLVRTDGRDALFGLIGAYKDGLTDDEAFERVLGRDFAAFQDGWLAELGADPPVRYGPQPAPAGPLPDGWAGPGQTPDPGATPGAATAAPGATPAATPAARPPDDGAGPGGTGMVVLAVVVVVLAVAIGLLVASRRSRAT
ncbi:MAG: peptidase MA family metallohydrolase [Chloroflexota bacterium]